MKKKLTLNRETLRALSRSDLGRVAGGNPTTPSAIGCICTTAPPKTSPSCTACQTINHTLPCICEI